MNALVFQIKLLQPVLATQVGAGEENSATAYDYIPGSAIRGAVIQKYLSEHPGVDLARDHTPRKLFFDGSVCYLNGYLAWEHAGDFQRMLPKPLSWRESKNASEDDVVPVYDFALQKKPDLASPKSPPGSFAFYKGNNGKQVVITSPRRHLQVHNASDKRLVKKQGESYVYRYDAIEAGQIFVATIASADQSALDEILQLLEGSEINLGGSRSAQYGKVKITEIKNVENWLEYPQTPHGKSSEVNSSKKVSITFLSDAILRDEKGQYCTDLRSIVPAEPLAVFAQTGIVGGFNRKWGLPLPQAPVIRAGSVFVYKEGDVDKANLEKWAGEGIGERRVDGFGRLAVDWSHGGEFKRLNKVESSKQGEPEYPSSEPLSEQDARIVNLVYEHRLRTRLEENLAGAVASIEISVGETTRITNTQLSRLRQAVMNAHQRSDFTSITELLDSLKGSRKQFLSARVDNQELLKWVEDGIGVEQKIWNQHLNKNLGETTDVDGKSLLTDKLKVEYVTRLLDGLLRKTSRANRQEAE